MSIWKPLPSICAVQLQMDFSREGERWVRKPTLDGFGAVISTSSLKVWRARERMGSAPFLARPDLPSLSFALLWRAAYSSKWGQWRAACPASRRRDGNGKKPAESLTSLHPVKFSSDGLSANFGGLQPSNLQKHSSI